MAKVELKKPIVEEIKANLEGAATCSSCRLSWSYS